MLRYDEKCKWKGTKGTPGGRRSVWRWGVVGWISWRQASGGQPELEELACDGLWPGLILSVCAGWQEGCKGRLRPSSHIHTQKHTLCSIFDHALAASLSPHLPTQTFLALSLHTKSISWCSHTHTHTPALHTLRIRHLLLHQQVVGLGRSRSHQGAGSCEGYWLMHWPDSLHHCSLHTFPNTFYCSS